MDRYTIAGRIGEGAHGLVLKGFDNATPVPKPVALKRILLKRIDDGIPISVIREVKTLQRLKNPYVLPHLTHKSSPAPGQPVDHLQAMTDVGLLSRHRPHENFKRNFQETDAIVELLDAFPAGLDFVMVFEYMPSGLWELLKDYHRPLNQSQIKTYMRMLLEGVAYMHSNNIMHRDLKPANLLIDGNGILKIADFGLSRLMWEDISRPYSHQVATRWYRAPELLYGARFYTSAIDMWAVGCIFGEMLNNSPLFPAGYPKYKIACLLRICLLSSDSSGTCTKCSTDRWKLNSTGDSDIEQLAIVLNHLGSPTAESWPELSSLPDYNKITFPYHKGVLWERIIPDAPQEAVELIRSILIYDSSKRLTAQEAVRCEYFHTKPCPCSKAELVKPPSDHRTRLRPKEIETNVKPTVLFRNLLSIM